VDRFLALAEKYAKVTELSAPLVNELIEKIVIHKAEKVDGVKHVTIEVFFNYVGKISVPGQREFTTNTIAKGREVRQILSYAG